MGHYKPGQHPNSLKNLRVIDNYDPEIKKAQDMGKIEASKKKNLLYTARTLYENAGILPVLVQNLKKEVAEGNNKNAIAFFNTIKESEDKNINLNGGVEVQKVFIDEKTKEEAKKHIEEFLDD